MLLIVPFVGKAQEYLTELSENQLSNLPAQTFEIIELKDEGKDKMILTPSKMYDKGRAENDKKNYTEAVEWYLKAAEQGVLIFGKREPYSRYVIYVI